MQSVLEAPSSEALNIFLQAELAAGKQIFPPQKDWFSALKHTPLKKVRVVIIGQDPYHGLGQAHGLSFSVPHGQKVPPSLKNIYKELQRDLGVDLANHGNLIPWADQGVLLLNSVLTVEEGKAGSHQGQGWEAITQAMVAAVAQGESKVVFMLWGSFAQKLIPHIQSMGHGRHAILEAAHPSPLSAYRGFLGCSHFSKANGILESQGFTPINWQLEKAHIVGENISFSF